eukprot:SAG31_NODE_2456_length_5663_cov_8.660361_6_plen_274_part_00
MGPRAATRARRRRTHTALQLPGPESPPAGTNEPAVDRVLAAVPPRSAHCQGDHFRAYAMSLSVLVATSTALQLLAAEGSWPDNSVGLCCSDSKLNCSCPRAPTVVWDACPQWHVGNNTIGSGVYDASGVLRQPDGTWHMFPDGGKWGHCTSLDLMHWDCSHPSTGFGSGDTGGISVTPKGTFALWPGIQMAVPTGPDLDAWVKKGKVDNGGGQRDPGRAILLKSGWYVPEGVTGIHWFRDESNGSMSRLNNTGTLVADGTDGFNEFEVCCCDR